VNAAIHFLVSGIAPLGALLAGLLAEVLGTRLTLLAGIAGMWLISAWLVITLWRQEKA
jgi:hypothetical protein